MHEEKEEEESPALSCGTCLREIDRDDAETFEVEDYVMHFCGLECYSKWQNTKSSDKKKD